MEKLIYELIEYGRNTGLIEEADTAYRINVLAEMLEITGFEKSFEAYLEENANNPKRKIHEILNDICDKAVESGKIKEDSVTFRDLYDTKIMGAITPPPSAVQRIFKEHYENSPKEATDYYYTFSEATNYIRCDRIAKDVKWETETEYGPLDITINLSKPEKDPKAIAAALTQKKSGYPACLLCRENEGYAGHISHPARQNHRLIPITLAGEDYYLQYSPYVYYNEHCIVLNKNHIPMKIDRAVFTKLFDFLDLFPHYTVGSNADLPIVGGSILSHDHFQGGNYTFAMAKADYEETFELKDYPDVKAGIVKWPMSVVRLQSNDRKQIEEASDYILESWRKYSDGSAGIYSFSEVADDTEEGAGSIKKVPHNTITPIARMRDGKYEIDLVLRNNRTDEEHPWGIYHPTADLHHIKKENIGLIEVMGLAILPARLLSEMAELERRILAGEDLRADERTAKHADWAEEWIPKYETLNDGNIHEIIQSEIGKVFAQVLECAGVFKRDESGMAAFRRFIKSL